MLAGAEDRVEVEEAELDGLGLGGGVVDREMAEVEPPVIKVPEILGSVTVGSTGSAVLVAGDEPDSMTVSVWMVNRPEESPVSVASTTLENPLAVTRPE